MKKFELKKIIKEELNNIIKEDQKDKDIKRQRELAKMSQEYVKKIKILVEKIKNKKS